MWEFLAGYLFGCFCMLLLARVLANSTLQTHEIKPIAARRINPDIAPLARLYQIHASALHHREQLEALGDEAVSIVQPSNSNELDKAREIVDHGRHPSEVLDELL